MELGRRRGRRRGCREPMMAGHFQHNPAALGALMSFRLFRTRSVFFLGLFLLFLGQNGVSGQAPANQTSGSQASGVTGGLTGFVTDPSGAGVPKTSVRLTDASGTSYDATTNAEGIYQFKALSPGVYTLKAVAKGFNLFTQENVQVAANQVQQVSVSLTIHIEEEKVQ